MLQTHERTIGATARLSRTDVAILLAAPVVALVARSLLTPWYQDANDKADNARLLADVAESAVRNDIGATLGLVSCVLYAGVALVIGRLARPNWPRVGVLGQVAAFTGTFGMAAYYGLFSVVPQAAREDDRAAMISLLDRSYDAAGTNISYVLAIAGALGWVLLGFALYRARTVPRAAAVLTAIGGAAVLLTAPGPATPFVVGAAVVSLIGLAWVAGTSRGTRDLID